MNDQRISERRKTPRSRCLKGARIVLANGNSTFACRIRNQSENGVRLVTDQTGFVPATFTLVQDGATQGATCSVSWRSATELGASVVASAEIERQGFNRSKPLMRKIQHEAVDRYPV